MLELSTLPKKNTKKKKRNWQNKRSKSCFKWLTGKTFIDVTWEMVLDSNYFGGNLKSSSRIHCRYKLFITRATAPFFFVAMKTGTLPITGTQICSAIKNDMNENDECLIPPLSRRLFPDGLEGKFCTQSFKGIQAMAVAAKKNWFEAILVAKRYWLTNAHKISNAPRRQQHAPFFGSFSAA